MPHSPLKRGWDLLAIVRSTTCVEYPARQGMAALYEPFMDTIVICTMTALVIVNTGVYAPDDEFANLIASKQGAALTAAAYGTVISWFPIVLSFTVTASATNASALLDFSDLLILAMALPNLIGLYILQGDVKANLDAYLAKWKNGEFDKGAIR